MNRRSSQFAVSVQSTSSSPIHQSPLGGPFDRRLRSDERDAEGDGDREEDEANRARASASASSRGIHVGFLVERRGFEPMAIGPWLRPIWSSSLVKRSDWPSPA